MKAVHVWPAWAILNLGAFAAGLVLPLVTVSHFYVFRSDIVLFQVPVLLARNGEWLLAVVVALFGIVLPVGKTLAYLAAPYRPGLALFVGRFSPVAFFDIFMIALLIFVAKGAFASDATTAVGMYPLLFFACSSKLIEWAFARAVARRAPS
jgi:paraquat-inducible protein A